MVEEKTSALRLSEERFRFAMMGANDGLWDWDLNTDEVYYSLRWKSMLGYSEEELDNKLSTWERLVHPEDRDTALAMVRDVVEGRRDKLEVEFRMRHKDGRQLVELESAYRDMESFSYSASHDLKQPLLIVDWHCKKLRRYAEDLTEKGWNISILSKITSESWSSS